MRMKPQPGWWVLRHRQNGVSTVVVEEFEETPVPLLSRLMRALAGTVNYRAHVLFPDGVTRSVWLTRQGLRSGQPLEIVNGPFPTMASAFWWLRADETG